MSSDPTVITAVACFSRTWQRILGFPYRRYIAIDLMGHVEGETRSVGYTQALRKKDIEYMALDYMACRYGTSPNDYRVIIEWN